MMATDLAKISMMIYSVFLLITFILFCVGFFGDTWYQSRVDPRIKTGFFQACFQGGCVNKPESTAVLLQTIGFILALASLLFAGLTVFLQFKKSDKGETILIGSTLVTTVLALIFIIAGWAVSRQNISVSLMLDFIPGWSYKLVIAAFSLYIIAILINIAILVLVIINNNAAETE